MLDWAQTASEFITLSESVLTAILIGDDSRSPPRSSSDLYLLMVFSISVFRT